MPPITCSPVPLKLEQIQKELHSLAPGWTLVEGKQLLKRFAFNDFCHALYFVNQVGHLAEAMHHHPDITLRWGEVTLLLWTHTAKGLTEADFTLAKQCEEKYTQRSAEACF